MAQQVPGRTCGEGITVAQLTDMFPDEDAARQWFELAIWPTGRHCPRCKGTDTYKGAHKDMPYRCRSCNKTFSVRIGTLLQSSRLPLRKWVWAIYLEITSPQGISSMKLHRNIGVTQKTAWFMLQRIRESFTPVPAEVFEDPVDGEATYADALERPRYSIRRSH